MPTFHLIYSKSVPFSLLLCWLQPESASYVSFPEPPERGPQCARNIPQPAYARPSKQAEVPQNATAICSLPAFSLHLFASGHILMAGPNGALLAFSSLRLVEDLVPDHLAYAPDMTS